MKKILCCFCLLFISNNSYSSENDETLQTLLSQHFFTKVVQSVEAVASYQNQPRLIAYKAKALIYQQKTDEAAVLLEQALNAFPSEPELHSLAAKNKFDAAQQASIFSAPSLAKEGLALLTKAHQLAPNNSKYVMSLIEFYLHAPGIVGGDEDEALKLAENLLKQSPIEGSIAMAKVKAYDDNYHAALNLLDKQLAKTPNQPQLLSEKAYILMREENIEQAMDTLIAAVKVTEKSADRFNDLYQIGRLAATHNKKGEQGVAALKEYLAFYQGSENRHLKWASLRLAQIYQQQNELDTAKAIVTKLNRESHTDKKFVKMLKSLEELI
ncbi:tetratricopeptide repeat protein [Thalassotalea ganghwensis]